MTSSTGLCVKIQICGRGTYSHLSPYCFEIAFVPHQDLEALKRLQFLDNPHSEKYRRSIESIPENHDVEAAGSAYFNRYPNIFFNQFRKSLDEHFLSHWRDSTHLPYLIGGTPSIANAFIRYLNDITGSFGGYETSSDAGSESSTEESVNEISDVASVPYRQKIQQSTQIEVATNLPAFLCQSIPILLMRMKV